MRSITNIYVSFYYLHKLIFNEFLKYCRILTIQTLVIRINDYLNCFEKIIIVYKIVFKVE